MCDTIVVNKRLTENRQNILVKNSDRPLGECQPLGFFPAGTVRELPPYVKKKDLGLFAGTGLDPKGSRYSVLGSRPYWLYGFEMGANEKGLFIGNEAEGSRCPAETEDGILGMDMLRFALEAAQTAKEAIDLIAVLLEKYGQSANASRLFDRRYENTYILCDPKETWVMETAGRQWAAKKIPYFETVSNCYTIETEFDVCSEQMAGMIRENRWLHPEEPINFAKAYTAPAPRQRMSVPRRNRMSKLVFEALTSHISDQDFDRFEEMLEKDGDPSDRKVLTTLQNFGCRISFDELSLILSDHFEDEVNEFRFGPTGGENCSICMHANTWDEAQTAASMLMSYEKDLGYRFRWAPASPCTSVYLPVWWVSTENGSSVPEVPACMSAGGEVYEASSLWWKMERLVSLVSVNEARYMDEVRNQLDALHFEIERESGKAEAEAVSLLKKGDVNGAQKLLDDVTARFAVELDHTASALAEGISEEIAAEGGLYGPRKEFLSAYAGRTKMPL